MNLKDFMALCEEENIAYRINYWRDKNDAFILRISVYQNANLHYGKWSANIDEAVEAALPLVKEIFNMRGKEWTYTLS